MREKNVHVCFDVGALFSFVSAAVIKHRDQGNLQFVWDNDSRGIKVFHGRDTLQQEADMADGIGS